MELISGRPITTTTTTMITIYWLNTAKVGQNHASLQTTPFNIFSSSFLEDLISLLERGDI